MDSTEDIVSEIKMLIIDCPDCKWIYDEQYTCTTCWSEGGNGTINVFDWIKKHPKIFQETTPNKV